MISQTERMHSYPCFPKDVIDAFQDLMEKYKLKPTVDGICSVNFENKYCRLNFNMDRYDLQGVICLKQGLIFKTFDKKTYSINQVAKTLFPDSNFLQTFPKTDYGNQSLVRQLLFWYADITNKYLSSVLRGDFSNLNNLGKKNAS